MEGGAKQQFPLLSQLEEHTTAESEIQGEKSEHPNKHKNYEPTPNIKKLVIKKEIVKPAEGWRLLRPAGAAERRRGGEPR